VPWGCHLNPPKQPIAFILSGSIHAHLGGIRPGKMHITSSPTALHTAAPQNSNDSSQQCSNRRQNNRFGSIHNCNNQTRIRGSGQRGGSRSDGLSGPPTAASCWPSQSWQEYPPWSPWGWTPPPWGVPFCPYPTS
ncbi:hypothetical protein A2U01_0020849, partial [Trifolium medium]|nr:hypothetical protein [Trifolium medium]